MDIEKLNKYFKLQKKLVPLFESSVDINPPSNDLIKTFPHLSLIQPTKKISEIVKSWKVEEFWYPLSNWINPRKGVLYCEGQEWLYYVHGSFEVSFQGLPTGMVSKELDKRSLSDTVFSPIVEVSYEISHENEETFLGGNSWQIFVFFDSIEKGRFTETEIVSFLNNFVRDSKIRKKNNNSQIKYLP